MIFRPFRKRSAAKEASSPDPASETTDFLTGDPGLDRRSLQLLLDTIADVASTMDLESLLVDLVDKSIEVTGSERGFLLVYEEDAKTVEVRVARSAGGRDLPQESPYSTSVSGRVLENGEPIANVVQAGKENADFGQSVYDLKLRAVMCVPLAARGRVSGAIYVDSKAERKEYTRRDLAFFAALAQQLAVSIENAKLHQGSIEGARLAKEMELAQRIQARLLPDPEGLPPGIKAQTWYQACEAASGDTFDVLARRDGSVALMLGDVSGHGIGPALIANSVQAALRSYLEVLDDLGEVLRRMNDRLIRGVEAGHFMSLFLAAATRVEESDDRWRLRFVNAGHGEVFLVTGSGLRQLPTTHPALGMVPELDFQQSGTESPRAGDLLFLCSDGLTESRNSSRDILGEGPLRRVLERAHGKGPGELVDEVRGMLGRHTGREPLEDDVMILALGFGDRA
ncbi:MAG: PP2C family protein-serine/threonine phosphatase [Planctomycetota bacterium]